MLPCQYRQYWPYCFHGRRVIFPVKKLVNLTEGQARRVSEYRFDERLPSENQAVRRLIELGLEAAQVQSRGSKPRPERRNDRCRVRHAQVRLRAPRESEALSEQAEGFADAIAEAVQSDLATKTDIAGVKTDIEALRAATRADIAEAKADIIKWMFGTIGFQTLIILGAVIALARVIPR